MIKEFCFDCNTYHWGPICRCIARPINKEKLEKAMIAIQVKYEKTLLERLNEHDINRIESTASKKCINKT